MRKKDRFIFLGIFGLLLFLSFNRHSKHPRFNYHSQLWADKAGYQVYLPALFYYDFDASQFPEDIQSNIGNGFRLRHNDNKVVSKYPIGVAVMQLPFFSIAALIDKVQGATDLGYTQTQHQAINVSTLFYVVLGLLFLFRAYAPDFGVKRMYLVLFLLVFGSNLYFYITRDAGLSHAYSFFTMTLFFYQLKKWETNFARIKPLVFALFFAALGCLIRPSNVVFYALVSLLFIVPNIHSIWNNRKSVLKALAIGLPLALILPTLQLFYYKYAFGSFFTYSYNDESFIYALNPRFARVWFAPGNGLLLYSPVWVLALLGFGFMWKKARTKSVLYALLFLTVSYLYAAWWTPGLGCGYGHRGFIELLPVVCLPILLSLEKMKSKTIRITASLVGMILITGLIKFQYKYDGCWYGNGYWDWAEIALIMGWN